MSVPDQDLWIGPKFRPRFEVLPTVAVASAPRSQASWLSRQDRRMFRLARLYYRQAGIWRSCAPRGERKIARIISDVRQVSRITALPKRLAR